MSKKSPSPKTSTSPSERLERIRELASDLRLHDLLAVLDEELEREAENWLERLERLLLAQDRARQERGIERRIKAAKFPAHKSLDDFDFDFQTGVDRDQILHYATLDWLRRSLSLLIGGMSGTGKSHIAIALGHLACVAGFRVRYTTSADLLTTLHVALATEDLQRAMKPYVRCELLIIDEVGLDGPERQAYQASDAGLLYKVVAARYEKTRSCIITTNIEWDKWGEYLGDDVATAAIIDRLAHHSYSITIEGPSWRGHEHRRLNAEEVVT